MFVNAPLHPAAIQRFALIIDGLCRSFAASHARGVAGPLILLVWSRLRRIGARFAAVAARVRSGTVPAASSRAACRGTACGPAASRPTPSGARQTLPRGFAWLVRLAPEAACHGSQLQNLLSDAEMVALLSAAPQMARVLRPLCRMLGVEPTPELLPPWARARASVASAIAPGHDAPNVLSATTPPSSWRTGRPRARPAGIHVTGPPVRA